MSIQQILLEADNFEDHEFSGPVDQEVISSASQEMGLPFPAQYRQFLQTLGTGSVASESFLGLGGPRHLDIIFVRNSLLQKSGRVLFPRTLIPVRSDGYGNYDCIDTLQPTVVDEYAIVEWLHDGNNSQGYRVLGRSYFEWFMSILKLIRGTEGR